MLTAVVVSIGASSGIGGRDGTEEPGEPECAGEEEPVIY